VDADGSGLLFVFRAKVAGGKHDRDIGPDRKKLAGQSKESGPKKVDWKALEIVHPEAAGIDVGGSEHWVAINPSLDPEPVRRFGCFTADLREMARWLIEKGVRSVAMQSTGVYWMPVFEILEQHNLEVFLVNARHTKNVPGRKSDIQECQWLLKLHAFGLLNNSFQPTDEIRIARTLWRQRGNLVAEAASSIQRIQKVLIEMNVQLSNVLSDLSGVSGMKIIGAILKGERDPGNLAALVEPEVKATLEDIAKSLEGNWRDELVFVLGQEAELYRFYQQKIADCDVRMRHHLESFGSKVDLEAQPIGPKPKGKKDSKNAPQFDLRSELYRITGIDWAQINGINVLTAQTVIAETGADLIVWSGCGTNGGFCSGSVVTGGRYNPSSDLWTPISTVSAPAARNTFPAVWTGSQMIVWSGVDFTGAFLMTTGGVYTPGP